MQYLDTPLACSFCPEFSPAVGWGIIPNADGEDEGHSICLLCAQERGIAETIIPFNTEVHDESQVNNLREEIMARLRTVCGC